MKISRKQKRHMRNIRKIHEEKAKAMRGSSALGGLGNKAAVPEGSSSSSSLETSKFVEEEVHRKDDTVSRDEDSDNDDQVPATITPDKNEAGEQLVEGEVAIPVKQLKTYTKARVIDKPNPRPKRLLSLKPRPPFPSPSFCFVCVTPVYRPSGTMSNVTKADCSFLINEMLELSKLETDHYLDRLKEPEAFIGLCVKCQEVIREAIKLRKQISELEMSLKAYQRQIVKTMKGTELNSFTGKGVKPNGVGGGREKRVAIENLLRFVYKRKYYTILSSQAVVGKMKDPRSGLDNDIRKETATKTSAPAPASRLVDMTRGTVTVTKASAPHGKIKAARSHPISQPQPQKKSKTIPQTKTIYITTPGLNKKIYLVQPKTTPPPKSSHKNSSASTVILKPASGEIPILNLNQCKELTKDPLALDDEIEDIFWPDPDPPDQKPEKIECEPGIPNPPIPSVTSPPAPARYLICGLCKEDKIYESGAQLQLHTDKVHGPPNPQPQSSQPPHEVSSSTKSSSSDKRPIILKEASTLSSRLEEEKRRGIVKGRKIPVYPTRTVAPLKTYSRKQTLPNSGNEGKNTAKGSDIFSSEEIDTSRNHGLHAVTKWSSYDCPICPAVKDYGLNRFIQHLAIHQRRPYRCTVCSELFPEDEAVREEHWKDKHSDAPIPSTSSPLEPPEKFVKLKLTPGQIWKCDGCPSAFMTEDGRDNHEARCSMKQEKNQSLSMPTVYNTPIPCSTCKKSSRNMEEWRLHRAIHHPEVHRSCCPYCDKSFVEKTVEGVGFRRDQKMIEHVQKDHKGFPIGCRTFDECESCGVVFKQVAESEAHFLDVHGIPTGERTFNCPICLVKIGRKQYLSTHINYHFPKEPSVCDICGISFSQKNQEVKMAEHKLLKHAILPESRKLHSCPEKDCQFKTAIKRKMDLHSQRDHEGARRYTCKHCGKGFMALGHLKQHELMHENKLKKPYQCEICGNSFAIRNYLYIHNRLSHEGRAFPSTNQKRRARPSNQPLKRPRVEPVTTD